jgi:hypothetical protein
MEKSGAKLAVLATVGAMVIVDVIIMHVFLFRPFIWGDGTIARFMF